MPEPPQTDDLLDAIAQMLLLCTVFGVILLVFWFGMMIFAGDLVYSIHGGLFDLTPSQLNLIHYCGMGLTKIAIGLFFFIPWLAARLVLKKRRG